MILWPIFVKPYFIIAGTQNWPTFNFAQRGSAWLSTAQHGSARLSAAQRGSAWLSAAQRGSERISSATLEVSNYSPKNEQQFKYVERKHLYLRIGKIM
jgi:hypothetical protein